MLRIALAALLLAATGAAISAPSKLNDIEFAKWAKAQLERPLKDPGSVQYRDTHVFRELEGRGRYLCGEINPKNSYGAYVGFQRFWVGEDGDIRFMGDGDGEYSPSLFGALALAKCANRLRTINK